MNEVSIDIVCSIPGHEEKQFSISTPDQNSVVGLIRKTCKENGIPMLSSYTLRDKKGNLLQWSHTLKTCRLQNGDVLYLSHEDEDTHVTGGCKWNSWWFVAAICIFIGGVGITAIVLLKTKNGETDYQYGVVMDAGSSHTSLFVYKWDAEKLHETAVAKQIHQWPVEGGGISSYTSNPQNLSTPLKVCLDKAKSHVPHNKLKTTPIFLGATAGMRMLDITEHDVSESILNVVRDTIKSYPFQFSVPETQARILTGEEEGTFGWITANYVSGILGAKPPAYDLTLEQDQTIGALDMGGASTQITFHVGQSDAIPSGYMEDLSLYGSNYTVYTHSFLCYGINEAIRRYMAILVNAQGYNETNITNPCGPAGIITEATYTDVFEAPCASRFAGDFLFLYPKAELFINKNMSYTFIGTGNGTECQATVEQLFNFTANCSHPPCSFNGVFQPAVKGEFYAFSSFFYEMEFLNLTKKQAFTLQEFESSLSTLCNTSWEVVKTMKAGDGGKMLGWYCFEGHYIHTLLIDGYKFDKNSWSNIKFISEINKTDIGWTLGYMLNSSNVIPPGTAVEYISTPAFSALSVLFGIFLLLSIAFGCHAMKFQKRGGIYEQVPTYGAV